MFNFIKGKDMATLFLLFMMMVALGEMLHGYLKVLNQSQSRAVKVKYNDVEA